MPLYKIQNCKDDSDILIVSTSTSLVVGGSYVFEFTALSEETSPIDGYCHCYSVIEELPEEGHYIVLYEVLPKISYADCQDCLKQHHDKEIKKIKEQYIVEWKESNCSTEKIQSDFCSFATQSYKRYLWEAYGVECYDKLQEGRYYVRYEMDRIDMLTEPCVCSSTLCYPVCLLDLKAYGEYLTLSCVIPTIESMDVSSCVVVEITRGNINGYTPSCILPSVTVDTIGLHPTNPGCSYTTLSITIDSITAS